MEHGQGPEPLNRYAELLARSSTCSRCDWHSRGDTGFLVERIVGRSELERAVGTLDSIEP